MVCNSQAVVTLRGSNAFLDLPTATPSVAIPHPGVGVIPSAAIIAVPMLLTWQEGIVLRPGPSPFLHEGQSIASLPVIGAV